MADRRFPPQGYYARITVTVVITAAVLGAAWSVRQILVLVLVAAVLAVGLEPAVRRLERWRVKRGWAVAIIFVSTIGFIALFAYLVVPPLVREATQLADDIPDYVRRLRNSNGWVGNLERKYHLSQKLKDLTKDLPHIASQSIGTILGITKSVAAFIFNLLTIAILTIYFMLSMPRLRRGAVSLFATDRRERWAGVLDESLAKVGGYVAGNVTISIIAGILAFVALISIGVPFPAALAMWVAITDLIPAVGATLGAIVCVAVAAFSGVGTAVITAVYFVVYQQVENYLIAPRVMKQAIDLSPAAVIVTTLVGGSLAGFAGALLALPVAATIKVVVRDILLNRESTPLDLPPGIEVTPAEPPT
ncbi:MAG: AI-2E family transporter [Actinomycetota bacterium]